MLALWETFTLTHLPTARWLSDSLILGRITGLLHPWRQGSWLLQWGNEIAVFLLGLVFSIAPFVPNAMTGVVLSAVAAYWLLLSLTDSPQFKGRLTPVHLLLLGYWGIAALATGLSPVKSAALVGLQKLSLYLIFFALIERVVRSPRWRSWLITVYLLVALVVSVYGLRQWFFGAEALATWTDPTSPLANTTRVYSYLNNPNLLAGYLLPAIPLSLAAIFAWKGWLPKALAVLMAGCNTLCLIFTFSRGSWLGLVGALFVFALLFLYWLLPYLPQKWRVWVFPVCLGSLALIFLAAVIALPPLRERVLSMVRTSDDSSNNFRVQVWASVREMIRDRPILGIGPGNTAFNKVYPLYQRPGFTALGAYSIFLELLVEVGVVGFSLVMWLLIVLLQRGWKQLQRLREQQSREVFWLMAAMATVVGMLIHGTVDTIWYRPEVATLWWFTVAIIVSYGNGRPQIALDSSLPDSTLPNSTLPDSPLPEGSA
jgi:putative inorganic carbon (hco3(-)) transporter